MADNNIMKQIGDAMESVFYKKKELKKDEQKKEVTVSTPPDENMIPVPPADQQRLKKAYDDYALDADENGKERLTPRKWFITNKQ